MAKQASKTVSIDLPEWMVREIDLEAEQLGISRKALVNVLLASVLRARKGEGGLITDFGYLRAAKHSLVQEWGSKQDEEAFESFSRSLSMVSTMRSSLVIASINNIISSLARKRRPSHASGPFWSKRERVPKPSKNGLPCLLCTEAD